MEIAAVKIVEPTVTYPSVEKSESVPAVKAGNTANIENSGLENGNQKSTADSKAKKELTKEQFTKVNEELNHFMSLIDSNIQFSVHEKSKQLMVQVVDTKAHRVIKEFPSHEMLDIMANIKDYVGALLDKRA